LGALVTNCDLPRQMARGVHRLGDSWLHVSGGLGTSMYAPFRFACRPEVCVLELVAREQ
jgi:predicted MPP superfamily phosphohydrolase